MRRKGGFLTQMHAIRVYLEERYGVVGETSRREKGEGHHKGETNRQGGLLRGRVVERRKI